MKKKPIKIPDCGWGMSKRRYKKGHPGFDKVPDGTFEKVHQKPLSKKGYFGQFYRVPEYGLIQKGFVLIQKKHLDEAVWALGNAIKVFCQTLPDYWTVTNLNRMQQALKNISVK